MFIHPVLRQSINCRDGIFRFRPERRNMPVPKIEIRHLSKTFDGTKVLDDVNLTIEKGDIYGILGLSGAGKSTLVRCINGLETFEDGEIHLDGSLLCSPSHPIKKDDRKKLAMIFQSFNLLQQRNVLQNVLLACQLSNHPKNEWNAKAMEALERVSLLDKLKSYPSQLSGGQCQRVAIARALVMNPSVILSDEATSALDPETTSSILDLFKRLNSELGLTIVMISHQMEAMEQICSKVAILDHSKIVENGNLNEVFLNPKSDIGRKLIYSSKLHSNLEDDKFMRIIFNGNVDEPIISQLVSSCHVLVSIAYASTKVQDGKAYGQTVIKMPKDEKDKAKIESYLSMKGIEYEEVNSL